MDLKLDAYRGLRKCTSELSPIWTKMAGITVRVPLFIASWNDDQSLNRRPRRFRVKPSLTRDLIWTALVQQQLRLNRGQSQIWSWFKLDRRWWNAPLMCNKFSLYVCDVKTYCSEQCPICQYTMVYVSGEVICLFMTVCVQNHSHDVC